MSFVKIPQKPLEITLVFGCCLVISLFELGVADKGFAVFAPVFWLETWSVKALVWSVRIVPTVDFQYSDIAEHRCSLESANIVQWNRRSLLWMFSARKCGGSPSAQIVKASRMMKARARTEGHLGELPH